MNREEIILENFEASGIINERSVQMVSPSTRISRIPMRKQFLACFE